MNTPLPENPTASTDTRLSGNGSVMRLSPLPAYYTARDQKPTVNSTQTLFEKARLSSRITHGSPICVDGCVLMSAYLLGFYHSEGITAQERKSHVLSDRFIAPGLESVDENTLLTTMEFTSKEIRDLWLDTKYKYWEEADVKTTGYTVHTLQAALWALWNGNSFEEVRRSPGLII